MLFLAENLCTMMISNLLYLFILYYACILGELNRGIPVIYPNFRILVHTLSLCFKVFSLSLKQTLSLYMHQNKKK